MITFAPRMLSTKVAFFFDYSDTSQIYSIYPSLLATHLWCGGVRRTNI